MYTSIKKIDYDPNPLSNNIPQKKNIFIERIECWEDTKKKCSDKNEHIGEPSESIKKKWNPINPKNKQCIKSNIKILNMDSIECGLLYRRNKYKPLVLNLADDYYAGGCVDTGSGAQEESLFRCTNYHKTLKMIPELYPIKDDEAIMSYGISIIKKSEAEGWKRIVFKGGPPKLSFIACPAVKYPIIKWIDGQKRLKDEDVEKLEKKMEIILYQAFEGGFDTIIWGAMGCGAWRNPSYHVAEIMKRILQKHDGMMINNIFAILKMNDDNYITKEHDKNIDNYDIFTEVFEKEN